MSDEIPQLLTVKDVCKILQMSERNVYELIKKGTIPSIKLGHQIRINREELSSMIRSNTNG